VKLLILMGLTGVGKSTAVGALQESGMAFTLLPNRRALTDTHIIPEMQRMDGKPIAPVSDRLERFALTRRYREIYPGGMAHVLRRYLEEQLLLGNELLVFDNLRGLDEVRAGVQSLPEARFILLDASPLTRLLRLVGRRDGFDVVRREVGDSAFLEEALGDLEGLFRLEDLLRLRREGVPEDDLLKAVRIIVSEAESYDMASAAAYLQGAKAPRDFLYLDTAALSVDGVREQIGAWL
jgi:hypothetical protein